MNIRNKKKSLSHSNINDGSKVIINSGGSKKSSSNSSGHGKSYEKPTVNSIGRQKLDVQKKLSPNQTKGSNQNLSRTISSTSTVKDQASQTDNTNDDEQSKVVQWCQRCDKSNESAEEIIPSQIRFEKENSMFSLNKSISTRTISDTETEHGENYELKTIHSDKKEFNNQTVNTNEKRFPKGRSNLMKHSKESVEIPANYKLGEIPEYLKKRKEELARIQKEIDLDDPCCPDGHILLPGKLKKLFC